MVDAAEKSPPRFGLVPLNVPILFFEWNVAGDVDLRITSGPVAVSGRERQRINVQIVQHSADGDLGMEFLEYQDTLAVVGIKADAVPAAVVG